MSDAYDVQALRADDPLYVYSEPCTLLGAAPAGAAEPEYCDIDDGRAGQEPPAPAAPATPPRLPARPSHHDQPCAPSPKVY